MEISPYQRVTLEVVTISTNPNDGDIYKVSSNFVNGNWIDNYALSKSSLDRITYALGISWISSETKRVDDRSDPNRVEFKAVGVLKQNDGTTTTVDGYKEIDLNAIEEELLLKYQEKAMDGKLKLNQKVLKWGTKECEDRITFLTRKAMLSRRKFKVSLAESGAKNRAVRSMGLKAHYTMRELQKPFIVPRVQFDPSRIMDDPGMKQTLIENAMTSARQLYGEVPSFHSIDNGDPQHPQPTETETAEMLATESELAGDETIEAESEDLRTGDTADNEETAETLSEQQRKAIFAQARSFWGDDADKKLHEQVGKKFGKMSVNELTVDQASALISALNIAISNIELTAKDLVRVATNKWNCGQPIAVERLNKITQKRYAVKSLGDLTPKQIKLVIGRIESGKDLLEEQQPVEHEHVIDELPFQ